MIGSGTGAPGSPLCAPLNARELELLPTVNRDLAEIARLQPGIQVEKVTVFAQSGVDGSIPVERVGDLEINPGAELNGTVTGGVINLIMTEFSLDLEVNPTGDKMLRVLLLPEGERSGDCFGNVPVEVGPAFYREFPPPLTEVDTIFGDYLTDSRYDSGDESHGPFAQGDQIGSVNAAAGPGGGVIFSGPPPFVTVEGLLDQKSGSFSTEGVGVVAGFPDITVKFDGRLTLEEGLNGLYEMGADGGLPGGESITYRIEGQLSPEEILQATTMPQVGPPPLDPGLEGAILDFVDVFNTSFENGSADDLFRLLHPAVFDIYGAEQCQVYLEGVVETPTSLEFNSGLYFGDWSFERDGVSRPVEDAYLVDVTLTANGQTVPQTQHLSIPGDDSVRWFTDCGEPLQTQ